MNNRLIFMRVVLGGRKSDVDFLDYMPWRHGDYRKKLVYATGEVISSEDRYPLREMYDLTGTQTTSNQESGQYFEPLMDEAFRDIRMRKFYTLVGGEDRGVWVLAHEYVTYLNIRIAEFCEVYHPYVVLLETFRTDIQNHMHALYEAEHPNSEVRFDFTPALSIPKTRLDAFLAQRKTQAGQRFGQAFHNYMEAHKCTQNKAWWDRLWNVDDEEARSMIAALVDWEN